MTSQQATTAGKCPSGIDGLDLIMAGGLPRGRTTLVYGGPGCGKTLMTLQFLARGVEQYGEAGVYISFEESLDELVGNAGAIGCPMRTLIDQGRLYMDHVDLAGTREDEAGDFSLEGLFIRIAAGIKAVGAQRIAIDSIEALFTRFRRHDIVREELYRLHRWLKDQGITGFITGELGTNAMTRFGIEEYLADAVIQLDHRLADQIATRRLRVVKLRGSSHGTNEYPFTISDTGVSVLPITSLTLDYPVSEERVSSGIERLDNMLGGRGYYRGSSVLISGTAGTGKTSLASAFAAATCQRDEKVLYLAYEEPPAQVIRNLRSIGIDFKSLLDVGLLRLQAHRATSFGLETHLALMFEAVNKFQPRAVIVDPISNLISIAPEHDVKAALTRLIDHLKNELITTLFTDLSGQSSLQSTSSELSSLIDTWVLLQDIEYQGERNRGLCILKSRGMAHSNQIRELRISNAGLELHDDYTKAALRCSIRSYCAHSNISNAD